MREKDGEQMKKALIVTTVSGFVPQFEMNNIGILQEMGCEIHYASNFNMPVYTDNNDRLNNTGIFQHQIDFVRSPYSPQNLRAYEQLCELMNTNRFDLVHCHTPMGGVLARLAAKYTKTGPVMYSAHGFHFYKGGPIKNWLFFYPVEKMLARYTDVLITINREDHEIAEKKFRLRGNGKVYKVNGVGIDSSATKVFDRELIRKEFHIDQEYLIVSIGELSKRKNHQIVIKAIAELHNKNVKYIICGKGSEEESLKKLAAKLNVTNQVIFAGYREDVKEIMQASDCFVFPSKQEGLSVALMEAMAEGMPVICSDIRGNNDLIDNEVNGLIVPMNVTSAYVKAMQTLILNQERGKRYGLAAKEKVKLYDRAVVDRQMRSIYRTVAEEFWQ